MKAKIKNAEQQTIRKSIESILFANGVKCDEEQFLIEDLERLLATCITPVPDTAQCSKAGEQAKKYKKLYKILTVMVREVGATAITINKWQEVENEIDHLLEKEVMGVSNWKSIGKSHGYWMYFEESLLKKVAKRTPEVVSGPRDYKKGFNDCNEAWKTYLLSGIKPEENHE